MTTRCVEIRMTRDLASDLLSAEMPEILKAKIRRAMEREQLDFETRETIAKADEERRAKRAESHSLTRRQAEAMCAAKWGQSPARYRPEMTGNGKFTWSYVRGMGGAAYRMIDTLVEEGMIAANRKDLTDAGKLRLEAWEKKHGVLYAE